MSKSSIRNRGGDRKKFSDGGNPAMAEIKQRWNEGGPELFSCCEDPAVPH